MKATANGILKTEDHTPVAVKMVKGMIQIDTA